MSIPNHSHRSGLSPKGRPEPAQESDPKRIDILPFRQRVPGTETKHSHFHFHQVQDSDHANTRAQLDNLGLTGYLRFSCGVPLPVSWLGVDYLASGEY